MTTVYIFFGEVLVCRPYPRTLDAPRPSLVGRAACARCSACLGVPAARRGSLSSARQCVAWSGAGAHSGERLAGSRGARAPHTLRAALQRCGARLCGSCASARLLGLGAAVRGVGRGRDTLGRAVGVCTRALAARALLRRACALVGSGHGWERWARGLMAPWQAACAG